MNKTSGGLLFCIVLALSVSAVFYMWDLYRPQRFTPTSADAPLHCNVELSGDALRIENYNDFAYEKVKLTVQSQRNPHQFRRNIMGPSPGQALTVGLLTLTDDSGRSMDRGRFGVAKVEFQIEAQGRILMWKGVPEDD